MIILSNNQWKCDYNHPAWKSRGMDCSAEARVHGLIKAYLSVSPDIMCLQEVSDRMSRLMMESLNIQQTGIYTLLYGKDTPIIYRSDKFDLIESGFYLFPETIPGLDGSFNNDNTKSYAYAVLKSKENQKMIGVMSVHLWWMSSNHSCSYYQQYSDEARVWQLNKAMDEMEKLELKYDCPCFISGDLNASISEPCCIRAAERGWQDIYYLAEKRDETSGYHTCGPNGFAHDESQRFADAIDHILVHHNEKIIIKHLSRINPVYVDSLSDHYPVYGNIILQ